MITQLTPTELKARLDRGEALTVVDVREPWELAVCALPGARHIPMRDIPAQVAQLPRDQDIVVLCHHGVRSQYVASFLERLGFERLHNLAGGIDAWAKDVDPSMAKY
jgi:rhodanese-related sulfurtransferase